MASVLEKEKICVFYLGTLCKVSFLKLTDYVIVIVCLGILLLSVLKTFIGGTYYYWTAEFN